MHAKVAVEQDLVAEPAELLQRAEAAVDGAVKRGPGWCWATPDALDQFGAEPALNQPTAGELAAYHELGRGNVTTFTPAEAAHPLNFFEQSVRCKHCGCDRLRPSRASLCCQGGSLLLGGEPMHEALIDLLGDGDGLSQTSRSLNDLFRFAQQGLPAGTHRLNLAGYQGGSAGMPLVSGFPRVDLPLQHEGLASLARGGVRGHGHAVAKLARGGLLETFARRHAGTFGERLHALLDRFGRGLLLLGDLARRRRRRHRQGDRLTAGAGLLGRWHVFCGRAQNAG